MAATSRRGYGRVAAFANQPESATRHWRTRAITRHEWICAITRHHAHPRAKQRATPVVMRRCDAAREIPIAALGTRHADPWLPTPVVAQPMAAHPRRARPAACARRPLPKLRSPAAGRGKPRYGSENERAAPRTQPLRRTNTEAVRPQVWARCGGQKAGLSGGWPWRRRDAGYTRAVMFPPPLC